MFSDYYVWTKLKRIPLIIKFIFGSFEIVLAENASGVLLWHLVVICILNKKPIGTLDISM